MAEWLRIEIVEIADKQQLKGEKSRYMRREEESESRMRTLRLVYGTVRLRELSQFTVSTLY